MKERSLDEPFDARYGFDATEQGIEEMERSLQLLEEDGDVYVPRQ